MKNKQNKQKEMKRQRKEGTGKKGKHTVENRAKHIVKEEKKKTLKDEKKNAHHLCSFWHKCVPHEKTTLSSVFHVPCTLSMASIHPTPEEMQQGTDISSRLSRSGLAGDPTEAASPTSFLRHLGFTSTAPVRVLGMISATDLTGKIDGENATPAQRAQAALVGSGARVAAGT